MAPASIPKSLPGPGADLHPLQGRRLGVYWDWFNDAEASIVDACKASIDDMCEEGAQVGPTLLFCHNITSYDV